MRRLTTGILALVATFLLGFGGTAGWAAEEVTAVANPSLTQTAFHNLPRFAAKHGVKLKIRRMGSYTQMQQAVETAAADLAAIGYVNLVHMAAAGGAPKAQAVSGIFVGGQNVVFRTGVKITKWKDVEGKTIGRIPGSYAEFLFRVAAKHNGADLTKVKFKNFGFSYATMNLALKKKVVDGLVIWSPGMDMPVVEGHGYFPPISVEDTPVGNVNGMMAMNTAFMKKNPGIANKIVKAFTESTRYYASNSKAMIQGARNLTGASIEILEEGMKHASLENRMFLKNAKTLAKLAFEGGIVKKNVASAVGGWMNYQFLMNATGKSKADLGG